MSMTPEELERFTLDKGMKDLDLEISTLKERINKKLWGAAFIHASDAIKLLRGIARVIYRLEKEK